MIAVPFLEEESIFMLPDIAVNARVVINDYSEAHGDMGTVYARLHDMYMIDLDSGSLWLVEETHELIEIKSILPLPKEPLDESPKDS